MLWALQGSLGALGRGLSAAIPPPVTFTFTFTGSFALNSDVWLLPTGQWNPASPFPADRSLVGAITGVADGAGILVIAGDDPAMGNTYDVRVIASDGLHGYFQPGVTITPGGSTTIGLTLPKAQPQAADAWEWDVLAGYQPELGQFIWNHQGDIWTISAGVTLGGVSSWLYGPALNTSGGWASPMGWPGCPYVGVNTIDVWAFNAAFAASSPVTFTITDVGGSC